MTQLQAVNISLGHLGMPAITQAELTANVHPSAIAANLYWEPARNDVLGEFNWSFATTTLALSALSVNDASWDFVYTNPTTSVGSIWAVFNDATITEKYEQEFEVKYISTLSLSAIFTNLDDAYGEFTYKVTDPAVWSNKFVMAFTYRLASMMSLPLGIGPDKGLQLMEISNSYFSETKRVNSSEKRKVTPQSSKYQDSR